MESKYISLLPYMVIILVLCVGLILVLWKYMQLKKEMATLSADMDEIQKIKAHEKENDELFKKMNTAVSQFIELRKGMDDVANESTALKKLEGLHTKMEELHVWQKTHSDADGVRLLAKVFNDAEVMVGIAEQSLPVIKQLQNKITNFYEELRINFPDDDYERTVRTHFLELSVMMMDVVQSINNVNYTSDHQGINVKLLMEEITPEEAVNSAKPVTNLDMETSKWAQVFQKCISKWSGNDDNPLIDDKPFLLNGYRFKLGQG